LRIACLAVAAIAALVNPAAAGDPSDVVVAGPLPADDGLTLSGRVVGGTGTVEVRLQRLEYQAGMWFPRTDGVTVAVPAGGRFRFDGLAPARYDCDFADERLHLERDERTIDLVRDVTGHDLVVPSNCRVKVRVTRATSHAPVRPPHDRQPLVAVVRRVGARARGVAGAPARQTAGASTTTE
jgi:hypothetical protein